jgi:pimeloyl-ACP methyl ester carboxylesterase
VAATLMLTADKCASTPHYGEDTKILGLTNQVDTRNLLLMVHKFYPVIIFVGSLFIALAIFLFLTTPAAKANSNFTKANCPFPTSPQVECGYLTVPENRANPQSRPINLAVALLKSSNPNPPPDPLIYLSGGPGQSAFGAIDYFLSLPLLQQYNMVILEQRGTQYSQPWLFCPEIVEAGLNNFKQNLDFDAKLKIEQEAAKACRDRFRNQGVDLTGYNSRESANDLEDLRLALGYAKWNLYGTSYGTQVALTTMRFYPDSIRSAILAGVYPPNIRDREELLSNAVSAFETLFSGCEKNPACKASYPALRAHFYSIMERLNQNAVALELPGVGQVWVSGGEFSGLIFFALYQENIIPYLPFLIEQVYKGDYAVLEPFLQEAVGFATNSLGEGVYYSVECHERFYPDTRAAIAEDKAKNPLFKNFYFAHADSAICEIWDAATPDPANRQPVISDIPTLLLVGEYDPTTPPAQAQLALQTLKNGHLFVLPGLGHNVDIGNPCLAPLVQGFLANPLDKPDGSCTNQLAPPDFLTNAKIYRTPANYRLNNALYTGTDKFLFWLTIICISLCLLEALGFLFTLLIPALRRKFLALKPAYRLSLLLSSGIALLCLIFVLGLIVILRTTDVVTLGLGLPNPNQYLLLFPLISLLLVLINIFLLLRPKKKKFSARVSLMLAVGLTFTICLWQWGFFYFT